ncbi:MAG: type II toxin-antitoxin system VapC family toxin [Microthrixaceae bacterium]
MTLYVDSSALMKRYVDEHDSGLSAELLSSDPVLVTSRITEVEVRRNLARVCTGEELDRARHQLSVDLDAMALVGLDAATAGEAARVAEATGCRSLDALHVGTALRVGPSTVFCTFDVRQARAAREFGLVVVGA